MFKETYLRGHRAVLLDPVDAAPWLAGADEPGQWAGSDPVLRDDPSTVVTGGAADPQLEPAVLWVVGNVDLIAHQYRDVPPPTVMDDGEVLCWQLDPDELPTVHLQKCPAAAIHWPHSDDRACRAPFELTTGPDTEGLGIADSPATPRRLDRASVAAWRRRAAELVVGPTLAAHLAARPPAPELLDLTPAPGGSEQQAWADTLLDSVVARQRLINHLQARQAADLSELERNYPGLVEFLPPEIGIALNVTENWASRQLDTARRIRLRLSRTWTGWDTGHLTADKAAFLADKTSALSLQVATSVESRVLPLAPQQTMPEFRAAVRRAIIAADPGGASQRHHDAVADRHIRKFSCDDGMAELRYHSTATDVQLLWETLTGIASAARTPGDERTLDQRRADALPDLCTAVLDQDSWGGRPFPKRRGKRTMVNVTMPITVLAGRDDVCELSGYGPITADQARTLLSDSELRRMVCDPVSGQLLEASCPAYEPPAWLAKQVVARDRTCVAPGCRMPADRSQLDHRVPYQDGGSTSGDNLNVLCQHHHRGKDGGGLLLTKLPDGGYRWTTPLGRHSTRPPTRWWNPPDAAGAHSRHNGGDTGSDDPPF